MPKPIDRDGVQRLVSEGAQLVEVLLRPKGLTSFLITTSDGRLGGLVLRDELERG